MDLEESDLHRELLLPQSRPVQPIISSCHHVVLHLSLFQDLEESDLHRELLLNMTKAQFKMEQVGCTAAMRGVNQYCCAEGAMSCSRGVQASPCMHLSLQPSKWSRCAVLLQ